MYGRGRAEVVSHAGFFKDAVLLTLHPPQNNNPHFAFSLPSPPLPLLSCLQLPETGYLAQVPLLQVFQQLVELRESGRVLGDVHQPPTVERQYSETKDILETWR